MSDSAGIVSHIPLTLPEEIVVSAQVVDGVVLIGTTRRVLEFDPEKGLRTLAHAEDRT